jgi:hypothetical protein
MCPMTKLKIFVSGMRLVQRQIALLVVFAGCAMVCLPAEAQRQPPARRGAAQPNEDGMKPAVPVAQEQEAEAEEGPPEKKYENLPVDTALSREKSKIGAMLRDGKFATSQAKDDFDNFYKNYFLARWSLQTDVRNLALHYRQELSNNFKAAKTGAVHDHLHELVLDFMKMLIDRDFHPAVKVNAMLMIGELNSVEQIGRDAAVPSPEALTVLIAAVENAKLPDGLRAAAMVGILRHASAGVLSADAQQAITVAMLELAAADLPAGSAASGRAWIAAQAVEILGVLGKVGANNAVFTALFKIVADGKLPILVRGAAADSLGRLNYSSATDINAAQTAAALCQFALDACTEELRAAKDTRAQPFRRRMVHRLDAVLMALIGEDEKNPKGIASLAPADQKALLAALQKDVKDAVDVLDDKRQETEDMKPTVMQLQKKLEAWLQKKP